VEYETVNYEKKEGRGIIFFNRPNKLNALNMKVFEELNAILRLPKKTLK